YSPASMSWTEGRWHLREQTWNRAYDEGISYQENTRTAVQRFCPVTRNSSYPHACSCSSDASRFRAEKPQASVAAAFRTESGTRYFAMPRSAVSSVCSRAFLSRCSFASAREISGPVLKMEVLVRLYSEKSPFLRLRQLFLCSTALV